MPSYDIITFGETMIRLSPPARQRLEAAEQLDYRVGGSESNTAIALARLGRSVSWFSKLTDNPLGRRITSQISRWGVDVSHTMWCEHGRVGVYFIEFGSSPRQHQVYYDRADSAASRLTPDEVDWSVFDSAKHLHLTGITVALSETCAATVARAILEAKKRGLTVSFDVNYRQKLWSPSLAATALSPLLTSVDLLICPLADATALFGCSGTTHKVATTLQRQYGCRTVVVTAGGDGATAVEGGSVYFASAIPLEEVDRVGAGDAFNAGMIHGWLDGDLPLGLRYGMAMAALKHTMPGDELIATKAEIEALVHGGASGIQR